MRLAVAVFAFLTLVSLGLAQSETDPNLKSEDKYVSEETTFIRVSFPASPQHCLSDPSRSMLGYLICDNLMKRVIIMPVFKKSGAQRVVTLVPFVVIHPYEILVSIDWITETSQIIKGPRIGIVTFKQIQEEINKQIPAKAKVINNFHEQAAAMVYGMLENYAKNNPVPQAFTTTSH